MLGLFRNKINLVGLLFSLQSILIFVTDVSVTNLTSSYRMVILDKI